MSNPEPRPDARTDTDGLPPLPADLEQRLYAIVFDTAGAERRDRLAALIAEHAQHAVALRECVAALSAGDAAMTLAQEPLAEPPLPEWIGRYRIHALLGEGGFGSVYRAEQQEPVRREVALKVLHTRRTDPRAEWRFLAERQTLARMQHAHIAQIYDAGTTADGRPFFAMEFVDGEPITRWCDRHELSVEQRLRLFLRVAGAVQHAHQRSVVHRDLKPGNVLVRGTPAAPDPKVIDFGVAKVFEEDGAPDATLEGALVGTPAYMSPEQATGRPVDTRTDVWSLGVLLYELLTGDLPFPRERLSGGLTRAAQVVRDEDPRRLTTALHAAGDRVAAVAAHRACSVGDLTRRLAGDLEWIVRRALAKDLDSRYAAVSELAADVERHLRQQPVAARQHEALYVLSRFFARHRLGVVLSGALLLATIGVVITLSWLLGQVESARRTAVERGDTAVRNEYAAHLAAARAALDTDDIRDVLAHLDAAAPEHRGWEWDLLRSFCAESASRWSLVSDANDFAAAAWLDHERVAVVALDGTTTIWWPRTGITELAPIRLSGFVRWLWSADRRQAFVILDQYTHVVALDPTTWRVRTLYRSSVPVPTAALWQAIAPDDADGPIDLGAIARAARPQPRDRRRDIRSLALSPGEDLLALSQNDSLFVVPIDRRAPPRRFAGSPSFAWAMRFSPDGERLLTADGDGRLRQWNVAAGTLERELLLDPEGVSSLELDAAAGVAFAAAGRHLFRLDLTDLRVLQRVRLANEVESLRHDPGSGRLYGGSGAGSGVVLAWDAQVLEEVGRFHGHAHRVHDLDHEPGSDRFLGCSRGIVHVYDRTPRPSARQLEAGFDAIDLGVAPNGDAFATVSSQGQVRSWDAHTLELQFTLRLRTTLVACAMTDERVYAVGDALVAIDRRTATIAHRVAAPTRLILARTDPAGRWLLAAHHDRGRLYCYRLPQLEPCGTADVAGIETIAWDHDRGAFAVGTADGAFVHVEPRDDGLQLARREGVGARVLASVPGLLAVGDASVAVRAGAAGDFVPLGATNELWSLAITADGSRIACGADNRRLRLLDRTGREVLVLDDSPRPLTRLAFVAGGKRLVGLGWVNGAICYVMVWGADVR